MFPSTGAKSAASALPSRTVATKMSPAFAAEMFSFPYAFSADVTASATTFVSPNPAADAFAETVNASIAVFPRNPADVTKNNASASSFGDFPTSGPSRNSCFPHASTCFAFTPTRPVIFDSDDSILVSHLHGGDAASDRRAGGER